jgi:EAL domain-containing protein (putative c-di-GMP-specific phosphodiesterase class I)
MRPVARCGRFSQPIIVTELQCRYRKMTTTEQLALDRIFDAEQIRSAYQPIVNLEHGDVVGAEALARWPGLGLSPDVAFEYARRADRVEELDTKCQRAAVAALTERSTGPKLVAEITERALTHNPAELLRSLRQMRDRGCGIALDDVGAVPDSLSLLPFLAPDVIKLDISLVQRWPDGGQARILTAVAAYAEQSGATVLAEGIETEAHLQQSLALGATLGQGWYFSRPGPLGTYPPPHRSIPLLDAPTRNGGTPFELLDPRRVRTAPKGLLLSISRHIEQQGLSLQTPPLVLAAFQSAGRFTPATAVRYRHLAERCPLVVALGAGMKTNPARGVRGADLSPRDPLRGEWTVILVGAHYTGALIAKDLGDSGPDLQRRYLFALTHDHDTVLAAARALLGRIDPV